ncbi:hypothetical protein [Desulfonema magnum]|uniref:Uncharacterized protein n=1 Tax=Desulfonema magnum TaxID=45655 RepID=A0A975GMT4_9BACT|nr:hypothetical protein [Desulfonema magnum]QTA87045.1 Uncharacterized protein dnm_030720 [Desulfonema magnum]
MNKSDKTEEKQRIITEMIDASIALARKIGKHSLTEGCNCIACVTRRKRLLKGEEPEWKYRL